MIWILALAGENGRQMTKKNVLDRFILLRVVKVKVRKGENEDVGQEKFQTLFFLERTELCFLSV